MGFIVFKLTGLVSRFQYKNWVWKICTESWDISQNVSNFAGLVWKANFRQFFGTLCIFLKTDFCVETVSPSRLIWISWALWSDNFFFTYRGVRHFFEVASPQAKSPQKWRKLNFSYSIHRKAWELWWPILIFVFFQFSTHPNAHTPWESLAEYTPWESLAWHTTRESLATCTPWDGRA